MPRAPEEIVQSVVGNPNVVPVPADDLKSANLFSLFSVELPADDFRGLPPEWYFAVLDPLLSASLCKRHSKRT